MREAAGTLIGLSFFCGAALYFCPDGAAKRVLTVLCTAVLASAALSPLRDFDYASLGLYEAKLGSAQAEILQSGRESGDRLRMLLLEENCERYLTAKAEELNLELLSVQLGILAAEDGELLPYSLTVRAAGTDESAEKLCRIIQEELGIPLERQAWTLNE